MAQKINLIGIMVREELLAFVKIDRDVFKKTDQEKLIVKNKRELHNRLLRKAGVNPKKIFNHKSIPL